MKITTLRLLYCCFMLSWVSAQAQVIEGIVRDARTREPLPFVNILFEGSQRGTTTDANGRFHLPKGRKKVTVSYMGYQKKELNVPQTNDKWEILLVPQTEQLMEVTVMPGENPAHRIIEQAYRHRDENNPENLENFSYESYSKFWLTVDSVDPSIDTVNLTLDQKQFKDSTIKHIDSSDYEFYQYLQDHYLFFMETVTRRTYKKPRDHEEVLAQRTSGFKNPLFALFVTQFQNLSLYNDFIGITGVNYSNPISKGSTKRYYFVMQDTLLHDGGDTTFYINFRPRPDVNMTGLRGVLAINTQNWALENFRAKPANQSESIPLEIIQESILVEGESWFPKSLEARIRVKGDSAEDEVLKGYLVRRVEDVVINDTELRLRDISKDYLSVERKAIKNAESILKDYRDEELDTLAVNTYTYLDSINEKENLDLKLNILWALSNGYLHFKYVDLNLFSLVRFNRFEGFRPGLGIRTNKEVSSILSAEAYAGYGFRDKRWKYRLGLNIEPPQWNNFKMYVGWRKELFETGGVNFVQKPTISVVNDDYRLLFVNQYDYARQTYAGLHFTPFKYWNADVSLRNEHRRFLDTYRYINPSTDEVTKVFENTEVITELRYAPGEETVNLLDKRFNITPPKATLILQYRKSIDSWTNSDVSYHYLSFNAGANKRFPNGDIGSISVYGGHVIGNAPASKLFVGHGAMLQSPDFKTRNITIASTHAFETMRFFEFLSSSYGSVSGRYNMGPLFHPKNKINPSWVLVHRMAIGSLRHPENHLREDINELDKPYLESGLEINGIVKTLSVFGLGTGFYYRYGANSLNGFGRNFALKITTRLTF